MNSRAVRLLAAFATSALVATLALPATAQSDEGPEGDLQALVEDFVGLENGGAAVVTVRDGETTSAAAGIANLEGEPMTVDTPLLVGGASVSMVYGLALQLVEEGLLDLDALVVDELPDAPVGEGATVRDLLTGRHGLPRIWPAVETANLEDPERTWTTDDLVGLAERFEATSAGEYTGGYVGTLVTKQLVEAVTGTDFETAMQERVVGPLGLDGTVFPDGDSVTPPVVAGGWAAVGEDTDLSYVTNESGAMRSYRPNVSTAAEIATFLSALAGGQVVSTELLEATAWSEDLEIIGYGFLRPGELFPNAGPLGMRFLGLNQFEDSGADYTVAVAPSSGDVVVVLTNSWALDSRDLARDIVRAWAPDPLASGDLLEAEMIGRLVVGMACDHGGPIPFDLPDCPVDGSIVTWPFEAPLEYTGTFEGSGFMTGEWIIDQAVPDAFTYTARGVFMGNVEGCGYGTFYFEVLDGAGHQGPDGPVYTGGTATVLPGGTLPLAGTLDWTGVQTTYPDGTATVPHTGTYVCATAP